MYLVYSKIGYNISHVILLQSKSEPYTMNTMHFTNRVILQTIQLLQSLVYHYIPSFYITSLCMQKGNKFFIKIEIII